VIWRPLPAPPPNGNELSGAPYDGELVDLWCSVPWRDKHRIADAWWETNGWYVRVPISREPVRVEGATHWMPIPPGPRVSSCDVVRRRMTWVIYGLTVAIVVLGIYAAIACVAVLLGV